MRGGIVELDGTPEVVAAIGTDPTPILGIALQPGNVDPFPTKILVALADSEKARFWFSGSSDPVAANIGEDYGVIEDSDGIWTLDITETTNVRLFVHNIDLERNLFLVSVLEADRQLAP